jgi:hypothetical protein
MSELTEIRAALDEVLAIRAWLAEPRELATLRQREERRAKQRRLFELESAHQDQFLRLAEERLRQLEAEAAVCRCGHARGDHRSELWRTECLAGGCPCRGFCTAVQREGR